MTANNAALSMQILNSKPHDKQFKEKDMYEVQTYTLCDGWINTWRVNDEPEFIDSFAEAVDALDDHLLDLDDNQMDYDRGDYRIHFMEKQSARAWTLSVQDDFGNWNEVDVADHRVSDIINKYILDLEESF